MRDDPPGINRHERAELDPVELDPEDYLRTDDEGFRYPDPPEALWEAECASLCGNQIGFGLEVIWDSTGREREEMTWRRTYRTVDDRYLCEDCATEVDLPETPDPLDDECPAGGPHVWTLQEEWGTGRTGMACDECHAPMPPQEEE